MSAHPLTARLRSAALAGAVVALAGGPTAARAQQQSLYVQWGSNATEYRGQNGRRLTVICPPSGQLGTVYGTDVYTDDSLICPAAVHAGVIGVVAGGVVTFAVAPGDTLYRALTRNGVASRSYGGWHGSFTFDRSGTPGQVDWTTTAKGLTTAVTQPITVVCPPNGSIGSVWGTDIYTDDSSICTAAVHAGAITVDAGGSITLQAAGAQTSLVASSRNGIPSRDYASWPNTFRVTAGGPAIAAPSTEAAATTAAVVNAPVTGAVSAAPMRATTTTTSGSVRSTPGTRSPVASSPTAGTPTPSSPVTPSPVTTSPVTSAVTTGRAPTAASAGTRGPVVEPAQPTLAVPATRPTPIARAQATGRGTAVSPEPADRPAVHATNFRAFAGYGRIALSWSPAPGAFGYRLARASWDQAKAAWIPGTDVEFPHEPAATPGASVVRQRAIRRTSLSGPNENLVDSWEVVSESTWVTPAPELRSDTVDYKDSKGATLRQITTTYPRGVMMDTTFTDVAVKPGVQYVYWLDTWYQSGTGGRYSPQTGSYPTVTAVPRDPAGMTWLPSEAERATPPALVSTTATADGISVAWAPKPGAAYYVIMRTARNTMPTNDLEPGHPCYPYIRTDIRATTSAAVSFDKSKISRFCIGIFAIYPNHVIDGWPQATGFWSSPDAWGKHTNDLMESVHSDGLFLWAEWDQTTGKWRLLPQGSFQIDKCVTERTNRAALSCFNL